MFFGLNYFDFCLFILIYFDLILLIDFFLSINLSINLSLYLSIFLFICLLIYVLIIAKNCANYISF